jgi:hypothetical protein
LPKTQIHIEQVQPPSVYSTASFKAKYLTNLTNPTMLNPYVNEQHSYRMNDSMQSIDEFQFKGHITAYDDIPIKSFSRDSNPLASNTISLTNNHKFEPNFHSDAYKS